MQVFKTLCVAETKDNPIAAQELARIAFAASRSLHGIVTKHPELLKAFANEEFNWPMLVSPYPNFCQPEPDWKRLGLGQGFPFKLSAKSRFNVSDKLGRLGRALETIVPLLPRLRVLELKRALDAENEPATAQRLGYLIELKGHSRLAEIIHGWLPSRTPWVSLVKSKLAPADASEVPRWRIIINTDTTSHEPAHPPGCSGPSNCCSLAEPPAV